VEVRVEIGKHMFIAPMHVADISNDYLLGADFLKIINLRRIFESDFGALRNNKRDHSNKGNFWKVSPFLRGFFEESSRSFE